ncbi:MAG: tyrosine-type recombinase/integrase [Patescibacteria group bacterium]
MGVSIREKPPGSGIYWLFISHRGRRTSRKIGTNRKRAEEMAEEIRHQLALDKLGLLERQDRKITFYAYARAWIDNYIRPPLRAQGTHTRYGKLLEQHIRPLIGSVPVAELSRSQIRDALASYMRAGASRSTVGLMHCVISSALNHAIDDELIESNPAAGLLRKLALTNKGREEIRPLTSAEVATVLAIIADHWPTYYPAFLTLFRTGLRLGELCALKWEDVNFRDKQLFIHRTARDQVITNRTKTGSRRRVDISDQLAQVIADMHKEWMKNNMKSGNKKRNLIFQMNNKLLPQNTIRRIFNRALERAGLDRRRIHDIRHTYASILLSQGTPIIYVKEQLGHTSIKTTVDVYGHLLPSSNRHAVNTLDDKKNTGYKGGLRSG